MSLYKQYVEEKTNKSIIETDYGFVTYSFIQPDTCYIEDIYVVPEKRNREYATSLAMQVEVIAQNTGYKKLLGTVRPSTHNATDSLMVLIAYGMKLVSSDNDLIVFSKEIK